MRRRGGGGRGGEGEREREREKRGQGNYSIPVCLKVAVKPNYFPLAARLTAKNWLIHFNVISLSISAPTRNEQRRRF